MWHRFLAAIRAGRYPLTVSLGRGCQPAYQIRRVLGISRAQVFDWILTLDAGLAALIESNLEGFFARDRLGPDPEGRIIDLPTGTKFFHEFPVGCDFYAKHAEHAGRYAMLAERWLGLLRSRGPVLFVRQHGWDPDPRATAARLRQAIGMRAPRLRFAILYLTGDPADEAPWGLNGVINRHLPQPEPYDWRGDDVAWERLLKDAVRRFKGELRGGRSRASHSTALRDPA